jgi:hypothetical protein
MVYDTIGNGLRPEILGYVEAESHTEATRISEALAIKHGIEFVDTEFLIDVIITKKDVSDLM